MAELKKWLAQGANPDNELKDAIVANDIDRVRYLLKHGAHADSRDGDGYTPLINAIALRLRRCGDGIWSNTRPTPNLPDRSGWTPLMYAAWGDNPELVSTC